MNPAADFWKPTQQGGKSALNTGRGGNINNQQKQQQQQHQQPYSNRMHHQFCQKKGYGNVKNWHYIHRDTFPSREQILGKFPAHAKRPCILLTERSKRTVVSSTLALHSNF